MIAIIRHPLVPSLPNDTETQSGKVMHMHSEKPKDAEIDRVTVDKLMADLSVLGNDIEQMLKATASETGPHLAQVRAKAAQSLEAVRARVTELQGAALVKTRAAGRATDDYVRANPWQVMAIATAVGLVVGILLARDGESDS